MKNNKDKGRLPPFVPLLKDTLNSPAWKATSFPARLLYIALKAHHNAQAHNNGRLYLAHRKAAEAIGSHKTHIGRWFRELEYYGFIVLTSRAHLGFDGKGKAPCWRLTECGYMRDEPTRDFMRWNGVKFGAHAQTKKIRIPSAQSGQGVRPKRTVVSAKSGQSMELVSAKSGQRERPECPLKADKSSLPLGGVGGALTEEAATTLTLPLMTVVEGGKSALRTEGPSKACAHCGRVDDPIFRYKNGSRPVWLHRSCRLRYWQQTRGAAS
jgi:hypothetical protein